VLIRRSARAAAASPGPASRSAARTEIAHHACAGVTAGLARSSGKTAGCRLGRLTNWKGNVQNRPQYWGHLVNELIYQYPDPDVFE
jgi:P63C domain